MMTIRYCKKDKASIIGQGNTCPLCNGKTKYLSRELVEVEKVLVSGVSIYDYENQAWIIEGKYIRCGHPDSMDCGCFGKEYEGKTVEEVKYMLYNSL